MSSKRPRTYIPDHCVTSTAERSLTVYLTADEFKLLDMLARYGNIARGAMASQILMTALREKAVLISAVEAVGHGDRTGAA